MKKNKNAYVLMTEDMLPKTHILRDCIIAFLVGGAICCIGQMFFDLYTNVCKLEEEVVKALVPATMVFLGAFFTGIGIYDDLGKFAGAGSVIPITGFAKSIVAPAMEFRREGYVLGIGVKMFTVAGPVIVYGTAASVVYGLIYWIINTFIN